MRKFFALGSLFVAGLLRAVHAQTVECSTACTVTIVHDLSLPPLQLTPADGAEIAGAILAVWAVGLGARLVIRALNVDGKSTSESET